MDPDDAQHEQDRGDEMGEILFWPTEKAGIHAANARIDTLEQQVVVLTSVCATQAEQITSLFDVVSGLMSTGFTTKNAIDSHLALIKDLKSAITGLIDSHGF